VLNYTSDDHVSTRNEHQQGMGKGPSFCILEYVVYIFTTVFVKQTKIIVACRAHFRY